MINLNEEQALKRFFTAYAGDINGDLRTMSKQELLEHLGSFDSTHGEDDNRENPNNYTPSDIFVGVASAATGINEGEFLAYAIKFFGHE